MAEFLSQEEAFFSTYMPKLKNQYVFYVDGLPSFVIKSVEIPEISSEAIELDHINVQRKIKGKTTWGECSLTMYDPVEPSAAYAAIEWMRLAHESITGRNAYPSQYKKDCSIVILGPALDKVSEYTLKGAWPSSINFGGLDWSAQEPQEISVTLTIDYMIVEY